jgi:predicted AAA+ superfamily ATPase
MDNFIQRGIKESFLSNLDTAKLSILEGARFVGKTTFIKSILPEWNYVDCSILNSEQIREYKNDPVNFIENIGRKTIFDEAQLLPKIELIMKSIIDQSNKNGQFVLTGSAPLSRTSLGGTDSLIGRKTTSRLRPFSQKELKGKRNPIISKLFSKANLAQDKVTSKEEMIRIIKTGGIIGFPENDEAKQNYINQILRIPYQFTRVNIFDLQNVLTYLMLNTGNALSWQSITNKIQNIKVDTAKRYVESLKDKFLVNELLQFSPGTMNIKNFSHPKIYSFDSGIAASIINTQNPSKDYFGELFETFVVNEIISQISWEKEVYKIYYWRTLGKKPKEVDIVIVNEKNEVIGIEIKAKHSIGMQDYDGLNKLDEELKNGLTNGFIVYLGGEHFKHQKWNVLPVESITS